MLLKKTFFLCVLLCNSMFLYAQKLYTDSTFTSLAAALTVPEKVTRLSVDAEKEADLISKLPIFTYLTHLRVINLKEFDPTFTQFFNLQYYYISGSFSTMPSSMYGRMFYLKRFIIDAELTSLPDDFKYLNRVQELDLSNNKLVTIPSAVFQMVGLKRLLLNNNPLTDISPDVEKLVNLEHLECQNGKIKELPETLGKLLVLEDLALDNNLIERIPIGLTNSKSLKSLTMESNYLKSIPEQIVNMFKLEYLVIIYNPISDLPDAIATMRRLWIEAFGTKITKEVIKRIENNTKLSMYRNIMIDK